MNENHNARLTSNAQKLRRTMTGEERHLWYDFLKKLPLTVHRQKIIGRYIVDFYIAKAGLVIELDGSQHGEEEALLADQARDQFMREQGLCVLRYTNADIHTRFQAVCQDIWEHLPEDLIAGSLASSKADS